MGLLVLGQKPFSVGLEATDSAFEKCKLGGDDVR